MKGVLEFSILSIPTVNVQLKREAIKRATPCLLYILLSAQLSNFHTDLTSCEHRVTF